MCALCKVGLHHGPRPPKKPYNQANLLVESTSSGPREFTLGPESKVLENFDVSPLYSHYKHCQFELK